jgi:uncharacterized lipoprotein YajG
MKKHLFIIKLIKLTAIGLLSTGCATNRGIIDVRPPITLNPALGPKVFISEVNDLRQFELKPASADIPSLKNGEINDPSITSRAVARKRNGYGKALGDILLPEGRTVADLVKEAAENALRERGYIVLSRAEADALPIKVNVHKFWSWVRMGFWTLELNFEGVVSLDNDAVCLKPNQKITGRLSLKTQAATTRAWENIINKGLDELEIQIKTSLKSPDSN